MNVINIIKLTINWLWQVISMKLWTEILKKEALYVGHHGWTTKKILDFKWSENGLERPKNIRNYKFLAKYFFQYFQIFSIFISNESLPMKSYQFFKIYKRFDKEREKQSYSSQWKTKTEKSWTLFYNRLFYKVL